MKTKASASETWDDLVFENRHKDYGAYVVRKHYSENMTAGLGVSVSMACLLVMLPNILAMFGMDEKIIPKISDVIIDGSTIISPPPDIDMPDITPPPPPARSAAQPLNNNNVPPKVTTTAEPDATITANADIVTSTSTPGTGDGPATNGVVGGTGTDTTAVVTTTVAPPPVFLTAEVMPAYEGGLQALARFIQRKVRTPRSVSSQGVSGTVFVSFVIRSNGSITDVAVVKGIAADCDREAMRLVSLMKDWTPGSQNHQPVSVRMVLPIKFQPSEL